MTSTTDSATDGSTDTNQPTSADNGTAISDDVRVIRAAKARQHTQKDDAHIPHETTVEGDFDAFLDELFDEDGMAFDSWWDWQDFPDWNEGGLWSDVDKPGEKRRAPRNDPTEIDTSTSEATTTKTVTPDDDPEAFIRAHDPDLLSEIDSKVDRQPGTREQYLRHRAKKLSRILGTDEVEVEVEGDDSVSGVVITTQQEERADIWAGVDEDDDTDAGEQTLDECPKCGATDVSASTVELQTRSADESGTQVTKTACGCTLRRTD